jgi:hypothetical protein
MLKIKKLMDFIGEKSGQINRIAIIFYCFGTFCYHFGTFSIDFKFGANETDIFSCVKDIFSEKRGNLKINTS